MSAELPKMPPIDQSRMLPYSAIRYVPGYPEQYVQEYAKAYAQEAARQAMERAEAELFRLSLKQGTMGRQFAVQECIDAIRALIPQSEERHG